MSQRARVANSRTAKASTVSSQSQNKSKNKKKNISTRKVTRSSVNNGAVKKKTPIKTNKKPSPAKKRLQQRSSTSTRSSNKPTANTTITTTSSVSPRNKRLSGLNAATLLQYCTNASSPTANEKPSKTGKRQLRSTNSSPMSRNNKSTAKNTKKKVLISKVYICFHLSAIQCSL